MVNEAKEIHDYGDSSKLSMFPGRVGTELVVCLWGYYRTIQPLYICSGTQIEPFRANSGHCPPPLDAGRRTHGPYTSLMNSSYTKTISMEYLWSKTHNQPSKLNQCLQAKYMSALFRGPSNTSWPRLILPMILQSAPAITCPQSVYICAGDVPGSGTLRLEMSALFIRHMTWLEWLVRCVIDCSHTNRVLLQLSTVKGCRVLRVLRGRTRVKPLSRLFIWAVCIRGEHKVPGRDHILVRFVNSPVFHAQNAKYEILQMPEQVSVIKWLIL